MVATNILVRNAGSSSLKYQAVDPASGDVAASGQVDRIETAGFEGALAEMTDDLAARGIRSGDLRAVGHRVVQGGSRFVEPTAIDDEVLAGIDELARLAPASARLITSDDPAHAPITAAYADRWPRAELPADQPVALVQVGGPRPVR